MKKKYKAAPFSFLAKTLNVRAMKDIPQDSMILNAH